MNPCPACGRRVFWTQKGRTKHIEWENQEYRKEVYREIPELCKKIGIRSDGTLEEEE